MKSVVKSSRTATAMLRTVAVCGIAALLVCSIALGWGRKPPKEPELKQGSAAKPAKVGLTAAVRDSFPDAASYPAVGFGDEIKGEAAGMLTSLVSGPSDYHRKSGHLAVTRRWWGSQPHPFLDSVLPGVRFLRLGEEDYRVTDVGTRYTVSALRDNRLYSTASLNQLLLDAGFTFDTTEMTTIAKIAVLFAAFGKTTDSSGRLRDGSAPTDASSGIGFPAITFLSTTRDTWHRKGSSVWDGVWVDCMMDGHRMRAFVNFWGADRRGRRQLELVYGGGLHLTPWPTRLPQTGAPRGRSSLREDPPCLADWDLRVSGDTWTETGLGVRHYFLVSQVNAETTNNTISFTASGTDMGDSAYFHFVRVQDLVTFDSASAVQGDSAVLAWAPGYDLTGEYEVIATETRGGAPMSDTVLVDPEAWVESSTAEGKTLRVHFMKYNDDFISPLARASADTILLAMAEAWSQEATLWSGETLPVDVDDTFDVFLGESGTTKNWFHVDWNERACYFRGDADAKIWIPGNEDYRCMNGGPYYSSTEVWNTICSHELWHACQDYLSGQSDLELKFEWTIEGQAICVSSLLYPDVELRQWTDTLLMTMYERFADRYLRNGLCFNLYSPGDTDAYCAAMFWRHLAEADTSLAPGLLVAVCREMDTVDPYNERQEVERIYTTALHTVGHPYGDFDSSLASFHEYACLTKEDGFWVSGGPSGIYREITFDNSVVASDTPVIIRGSAQPHTGRAYRITKGTSQHRDSLRIEFDGSAHPQTHFTVQGIRFAPSGGQPDTFRLPLDPSTRRADTTFVNSSWKKVYVVVTNPDCDTAGGLDDGVDFAIRINPSGDVAVVSSNPGGPAGGTFSPPKRYYRWGDHGHDRMYPFADLTQLDSIAGDTWHYTVVCSIVRHGGAVKFRDTASLDVTPTDTSRVDFSPWDWSDEDSVPADSYQAIFYIKDAADTNPTNDTLRVDFVIKDTSGLPVDDEDFEGEWPADYDDWQSVHHSEFGSCWHHERINGNGRMRLNWHNDVLCYDTLKSPRFNFAGAESVRLEYWGDYMPADGPGPPPATSCSASVYVQVGGGFYELDTITVGGGRQVGTFSLSAAQAAGQRNVRFGWAHKGNLQHTEYWDVDNFSVRVCPHVDKDIVVEGIFHPKGGVTKGSSLKPMATVGNWGCTFETCNVYFIIDQNYSSSKSAVLAPGTHTVVTFDDEWTAGSGMHACTAYVSPVWGDHRPANDTATGTCEGLSNEFRFAHQYPIGDAKRGFPMTEHNGAVFVRGGATLHHHCVSYAWYPQPICNWDTIADFRLGSVKQDYKGAGIVSVGGTLYATYRSAPGGMDTKESGCSMKPEVRIESGKETAEELYA